jgi:hypothetical protein
MARVKDPRIRARFALTDRLLGPQMNRVDLTAGDVRTDRRLRRGCEPTDDIAVTIDRLAVINLPTQTPILELLE